MRIGVPKEIKPKEGRVALVPSACAELVGKGHEVFIQTTAGELSGFEDDDYKRVGASISSNAEELYASSEMIVKVKEPLPGDLQYLRERHLLFCFLHLAAELEVARALQQIGLTAVAFETVTDEHGRLPLLAPMSDIAGRISVQVGTHLLHAPQGGRGILLGGVPSTPRGNVVVIGCGIAGTASAKLAAQLGANVTAFDLDRQKLARLEDEHPNITGLHAFEDEIALAVREADLLVGAVLVPGRRAPKIVTREMVCSMRPGTVIADISIDQGGCVETSRPITYDVGSYIQEDVTHFTVTNMPGAVPRTSAEALSSEIIAYAQRLTQPGWDEAPDLKAGINVRAGRLSDLIAEEIGQS